MKNRTLNTKMLVELRASVVFLEKHWTKCRSCRMNDLEDEHGAVGIILCSEAADRLLDLFNDAIDCED